MLTGSPPFTRSNPEVVISQQLSASPPAVGERRPELAGLDPVLAAPSSVVGAASSRWMSARAKSAHRSNRSFGSSQAPSANCSPPGSTGTTADGFTAYCSTLQTTGAAVWSPSQGDIPSPTVTTGPTDTPLPTEDESPVRVCMRQTGMTRLQCWESIRLCNGRPAP